MSGIVISHSYDAKIEGGLSWKEFAALRYIRLYPLYLAGTAISLLLTIGALIAGQPTRWSWPAIPLGSLTALLGLPYPFASTDSELYPFNMPAWSLFWEFVINIIYAVVFPYLTKPRIISIVSISALALIGVAATTREINFGYQWPMSWVGFIRVSYSFFAGVFIGRCLRDGVLPDIRVPAIALIILTISTMFLPISLGAMKDIACILIVFPFVCIAAVLNQPRFISIYTFLGLISYPLYVIHVPMLKITYTLISKLTHAPIEGSAPQLGLVMLAALIFISWILALWFDPKARKILRQISVRRIPATV